MRDMHVAPRAASLAAAWVRRLSVFGLYPALTVVNALVGLLIPLILGPAEFGSYALAVTLFQYGLIFDLGLSQIIDRRVPALLAAGRQRRYARFVSVVLWLRLLIAGVTLLGGTALLTGLALAGRLPFGLASGLLSLLAGLAFMIALGPLAVRRAALERRAFALGYAALAAVLAVARPAGLVLGGALGSFAGMAACYLGLAVFYQSRMLPEWRHRPGLPRVLALLREGLPLFMVAFAWAFYLTANRWAVSRLAPLEELGHFAFCANILYLLVGTLGGQSQYYYPKVARRFATEGRFSTSRLVLRDLCRLLLALTLVAAVGLASCGWFTTLFYPSYVDAIPTMRVLICAMPALVLAAWLMPLSLSTDAARPPLPALLLYPAVILVLVLATTIGYRQAGMTGAGLGPIVSVVPLLAGQLATLRWLGVLTTPHAAALLGLAVAASAGLLLIAAIQIL